MLVVGKGGGAGSKLLEVLIIQTGVLVNGVYCNELLEFILLLDIFDLFSLLISTFP